MDVVLLRVLSIQITISKKVRIIKAYTTSIITKQLIEERTVTLVGKIRLFIRILNDRNLRLQIIKLMCMILLTELISNCLRVVVGRSIGKLNRQNRNPSKYMM